MYNHKKYLLLLFFFADILILIFKILLNYYLKSISAIKLQTFSSNLYSKMLIYAVIQLIVALIVYFKSKGIKEGFLLISLLIFIIIKIFIYWSGYNTPRDRAGVVKLNTLYTNISNEINSYYKIHNTIPFHLDIILKNKNLIYDPWGYKFMLYYYPESNSIKITSIGCKNTIKRYLKEFNYNNKYYNQEQKKCEYIFSLHDK